LSLLRPRSLHTLEAKTEPETQGTGCRKCYWQSLVKREATQVVLLDGLVGVQHIQQVNRRSDAPPRKAKLTAQPKVPVRDMLRTVSASRASSHRGCDDERSLG